MSRTKYPLTEAKRQRLLRKSELAMKRRFAARKKDEKERTSKWWALWMHALGIRQFK